MNAYAEKAQTNGIELGRRDLRQGMAGGNDVSDLLSNPRKNYGTTLSDLQRIDVYDTSEY